MRSWAEHTQLCLGRADPSPDRDGLPRIDLRLVRARFLGSPKGHTGQSVLFEPVAQIADTRKVKGDLTLIGCSMGGAISTAFAAAHPNRVRRLILLAAAGMAMAQTKLTRFIIEMPVIGDWLLLALYRKGVRAERNHRGFTPAVLASLRGVLSQTNTSDHKALDRAAITKSFPPHQLAPWQSGAGMRSKR